jgi:hypothetical protein
MLGLLGILVLATSVVLQFVAHASGNPWMALALTLGAVTGALLYRKGFSQVSR